jgi:hypothetical protein
MEIQSRAVTLVAEAMGLPSNLVAAALGASFTDRCRGRWGSFPETMARLAGELGADLAQGQLEAVCATRLASQRGLMHLRPYAEPVLASL